MTLTPTHPPCRTPGLCIPLEVVAECRTGRVTPGRCMNLGRDGPGVHSLPPAGPASLLRDQDARTAILSAPPSLLDGTDKQISRSQHGWLDLTPQHQEELSDVP